MSKVLNLAAAVTRSEYLAIRPPRDVRGAPPEFQAVDELLREAFYGCRPISTSEAASSLVRHLGTEECPNVVNAIAYVEAWLKHQDSFFDGDHELVVDKTTSDLQQGVNRLYCKHFCPTGDFAGNEDGIAFVNDVASFLAVQGRHWTDFKAAARAVALMVATKLAYFNGVVLPLDFHTRPEQLEEILEAKMG